MTAPKKHRSWKATLRKWFAFSRYHREGGTKDGAPVLFEIEARSETEAKMLAFAIGARKLFASLTEAKGVTACE